MSDSLIPREAAQLALSLELIAIRKTGEKLTSKALARVRKRTVEVSGCAPAFAAQVVQELTAGIKEYIEPARRKVKRGRR